MLSNCGHDEYGRYSGGTAGDQTGTEWQIVPWYSRPWKYVFRHPDKAVRQLIADKARACARNNCIGYDQGQRYTFWEQLQKVGYDPAKISFPCEADCSSGVAAIVKAVGYDLGLDKLKAVSIYCYTGNLRAALAVAGFEVLTESKYLVSDQYLRAGDILLLENAHTAINLDDGVNITEPVSDPVHVTYCVHVEGRWLPEVVDLSDYAGLDDKPITGFALKVSRGHAKYMAHVMGKGWYDWVDTDDYNPQDINYGMAGDYRNPIDAIRIYYFTDSGEELKSAAYRVDTVDRRSYYAWQIDTDTDKGQDGYAGAFGHPIDRVQVCVK